MRWSDDEFGESNDGTGNDDAEDLNLDDLNLDEEDEAWLVVDRSAEPE